MKSVICAVLLLNCVALAQNAARGTLDVAPGSLMVVGQCAMSPPVPSARVTAQFQPQGSETVYTQASIGTIDSGRVVVVPKEMPLGLAVVTGLSDGKQCSRFTVNVAREAPGLFAVAQNVGAGAAPVDNRLTSPALPGQYLSLWGTGLGDSGPDDVAVRIGGIDVKPAYAGPAPDAPGMDQVNFLVPSDTPDGCYVPIRVRVRGAWSNERTIAKASEPGYCAHPLSLSGRDLETLDAGGVVAAGSMRINQDVVESSGFSRTEGVEAVFWERPAKYIFLLARALPASDYYGCSPADDSDGEDTGVRLCAGEDYDAGASLTFKAADGSVVPLRGGSGFGGFCPTYGNAFDDSTTYETLAAMPAAALAPGSWTVSGPGGRVIQAFSQNFALPPPIRWTNRQESTKLTAGRDAAVTWDPAGYSAGDVMRVTIANPGLYPKVGGRPLGLVCRAPAKDGALTIPAVCCGRSSPRRPIRIRTDGPCVWR